MSRGNPDQSSVGARSDAVAQIDPQFSAQGQEINQASKKLFPSIVFSPDGERKSESVSPK